MEPQFYAELYKFFQSLPSICGSNDSLNDDTSFTSLPGYPDIAIEDTPILSEFLLEDLQCQDLDELSDRLWMMTEQRSANISPLHRQKVKGREIIVAEEPKLHLIWFYDRIYLKPLPEYLLSQRFWCYILAANDHPKSTKALIRSSALGFIRSYAHLIKYESDFRIARSNSISLLPAVVSWGQWRLLRAKLLAIRDEEVSLRYRFGEVRLTRLNLYSKLLLRKPYYHRTYRQYGEYFASFYAPLLFLFGIVSVILGAMQLAATVEEYDAHWPGLVGLYRTASAIIMVITSLLLLALITIFLYKIGKEWKYAWKCRYAKSRKVGSKQSKP